MYRLLYSTSAVVIDKLYVPMRQRARFHGHLNEKFQNILFRERIHNYAGSLCRALRPGIILHEARGNCVDSVRPMTSRKRASPPQFTISKEWQGTRRTATRVSVLCDRYRRAASRYRRARCIVSTRFGGEARTEKSEEEEEEEKADCRLSIRHERILRWAGGCVPRTLNSRKNAENTNFRLVRSARAKILIAAKCAEEARPAQYRRASRTNVNVHFSPRDPPAGGGNFTKFKAQGEFRDTYRS